MRECTKPDSSVKAQEDGDCRARTLTKLPAPATFATPLSSHTGICACCLNLQGNQPNSNSSFIAEKTTACLADHFQISVSFLKFKPDTASAVHRNTAVTTTT